jgi:tRNA(Ile)-lysidine synthase
VAATALETLADVIRDSGLVPAGSRGVVLVSGGPDSACAAAGVAAHAGPDRVAALHLNYGLRDDSDDDESACRELCELLGVELTVECPGLEAGNVQAAARAARYAAAERLADRTGAKWIATGHTRTDLAETFLYRVSVSPGVRALLGLPRRRGRVVRPLLSIDRSEARRLATGAGLPFRDDPSNVDPRYARNRLRDEVLPVLREIGPAVEANIAATHQELAAEAEVLRRVAAEALEVAGAGDGAVAVRAKELEGLEPALRRIALRELAERAAGAEVALGPERAAEIWRLASEPEGGTVELGGGLRAACEHGMIRFGAAEEPPPNPATLSVPGHCRFGRWEVRAELRSAPVEPAGPELATLDAAALGTDLVVRAWRKGDRMRPLGLGGSKSLQDLFSDARVPRSLRRVLPLVTSGERIAWVAGVAVSEEFRLTPAVTEVTVLSARIAE